MRFVCAATSAKAHRNIDIFSDAANDRNRKHDTTKTAMRCILEPIVIVCTRQNTNPPTRPASFDQKLHSFVLPVSSSYFIAGDHIPSDSAMPQDPGGEKRHIRNNRGPHQRAPRSKPQSRGGFHCMERHSEMGCISQRKHAQQRLVD